MPTAKTPLRSAAQPPSDRIGPLFIIGASARQSAQSACRAGIEFVAVDLFGDWDLCQLGPTTRIESFEEFDSLAWLDSLPMAPQGFMIAGGMEKRCGLIAALAERVPFAGPDPRQIEKTNDPFLLAAFCRSQGIKFPEVHSAADFDGRRVERKSTTGSDTDWIVKPCHSAGGSGIEFCAAGVWHTNPDENNLKLPASRTGLHASRLVRGNQAFRPAPPRGRFRRYVQRFVSGRSFSSLFCGDGQGAILIGSTTQLIGESPFTMRRFGYCGSIGPIPLAPKLNLELGRIGNVLACEFNLRGVFGVDWILEANDDICLIEINPRVTASAELFELAGVKPRITELHLRSAAGNHGFEPGHETEIHGKAILFSSNSKPFVFGRAAFDRLLAGYLTPQRQAVADVPGPGSTIFPGQPILTLLASGNCESTVRIKLVQLANDLQPLFGSG